MAKVIESTAIEQCWLGAEQATRYDDEYQAKSSLITHICDDRIVKK